MKRRTFDAIASLIGLMLAVLFLTVAGLMNWGASFTNDSVKTQLSAQAIHFPGKTGNSKESADVTKFFADNANKIMTTGKQAQMYAENYIGFHLSHYPTYEVAANNSRAADSALAGDPTNVDLQAKAKSAAATVETVFKGTALQGTLLTAYAFGFFGTLAGIGTIVSLVTGLLFLLLALLGYMHLRRTDDSAAI